MQDIEFTQSNDAGQVYIHKTENIVAYNQFTGKQAGKAPSLLQLKIIYYGLNEVCKTGNLVVRFPISEFWKYSGVTTLVQKHTELLIEGVADLFTRLTFKGSVDPVTGHRRIEFFPWVYQAAVVETDNGADLELHFSPMLREDILSDENTISFSLSSIISMNSKYGPRLYDILLITIAGYSSVVFEKSLDDFRAYMDATQVKRAVDLRKNVIEPAVREVNDHTNLHVEFEMRKTGRAFSHVRFTVRKKKQLPLEETASNALEPAQNNKTSVAETISLMDMIRSQIGYDAILSDLEQAGKTEDIATLNLILDIMADVYATSTESVPFYKLSLNGTVRNVPHDEVTKRFQELNQFHVVDVIERVENYPKKIISPRSFVFTCLFNAPLTMDIQVRSAVNEQMEKCRQEGEAAAEQSRRDEAKLEDIRAALGWYDAE